MDSGTCERGISVVIFKAPLHVLHEIHTAFEPTRLHMEPFLNGEGRSIYILDFMQHEEMGLL